MLIRTTVTLPEILIEEAKYYALTQKTSLSQLVRESLAEKIKSSLVKKPKSILGVAGSLDLKGKKPPKRSELYARHLKQKVGN